MIEGRRRVRRFAADYLSAHGASMLPHIGAPSRTSSTVAPPHLAVAGLARCVNSVIPRCSPVALLGGNRSCPKCHTAQTREWLGSRRAEIAAGAALPRHRHSARRVARGAACSSARRLCRADAVPVPGRSSNSLAIPDMSAAPSPCSPCCTPGLHTIEPAPARSLPGQRRRYIRGRHHLASGAAERPGAHQGARQIGARQVPDLLRRKCPDLVIPEAVWSKRWILHVTAWGDGEQAVLGLPRPLRLSHQAHQRSHRRTRRRSGHHPAQGTQDRPTTNLPSQRR